MRIILAILLTFIASLSTAEPSSDVRTLMDQKLTIFDWGLFKLEQELELHNINASVMYMWPQNQVSIRGYKFDLAGDPKTMEQTKSDCEGYFAKIDEILWIKDGADVETEFCFFCSFFSHNGFTSDGLNEAQKNVKHRLYYSYSDGHNHCTRKAYGIGVSVMSYN